MKITLYEKKREAPKSEFSKTTHKRLLWLIDFISNIEEDKEAAKIRIDALFNGEIVNTDLSSFILIQSDIKTELSKEEKVIISHALSEKMDKTERILIKRMEKCGFENYKPPFIGPIADEKFMEAAKHYWPDTTKEYIMTCELYEKWETE